MRTLFRSQLFGCPTLKTDGIHLTRRGRRGSGIIDRTRRFIHAYDTGYIHLVLRQATLDDTLCRSQIDLTPSVFLAQHDNTTVRQPFPFVEERIVDIVRLAAFAIERPHDSRFGATGMDGHARLITVQGHDDQVAYSFTLFLALVDLRIGPAYTGDIHRRVATQVDRTGLLGHYIIHMYARPRVLLTGLGIVERVQHRIRTIQIALPIMNRHTTFVQPDEGQLAGVGREGHERGLTKLLLIEPVAYAVEDEGILGSSNGYFSTEIELMDIDITILDKGHIASVRRDAHLAHLTATDELARLALGVAYIIVGREGMTEDLMFVLMLQSVTPMDGILQDGILLSLGERLGIELTVDNIVQHVGTARHRHHYQAAQSRKKDISYLHNYTFFQFTLQRYYIFSTYARL